MRIDRISITNFRIYQGSTEIIFKKGIPQNNISIIAGQNGFGKTTFLTAIIWGFYGKLMNEVDENYKREIFEYGGYKKFTNSILNRDIRASEALEKKFSIEIEISNVHIPSVPCSSIIIQREYDIETDEETTTILIDGSENELTKEVGSDIFINDFILPREIAKFFLFDAEKIVSLAEIKTASEKKRLSKAYSEVLGINKYEKLKHNLENLRVKLRKRSASIADRSRLEKLQTEADQIEKLIRQIEENISNNSIELNRIRELSEQYQEKLIREGDSMSVEEMIGQKKLRDKLREQGIDIKAKLKELIELAPFAIAGHKLVKLQHQVKHESLKKQFQIDSTLLKDRLNEIKQKVDKQIQNINIESSKKDELFEVISDAFAINLEEQENTLKLVLLDLTAEQTNEFNTLFDNIKLSFSILFKQIVKEERNNRIFLAKTLRKISNAEAKDTDVLIKKYKVDKAQVDKRIKKLSLEQNKLYEELGALQQDLTSKSKVISEFAKTVSLDKMDAEKDQIAERLIHELTDFVYKFKSEKKLSLQKRIQGELHRLMHKDNFIDSVDVELIKDIIEINLLDNEGNIIEKETLSKGEQQLFATALLKSLVDESGFEFPIFIDSPLQKFDKKHSENIITKFYPSISKQVILFPLIEKELTKNEYALMSPYINQTYLIKTSNNSSTIQECDPIDLYSEIDYSKA